MAPKSPVRSKPNLFRANDFQRSTFLAAPPPLQPQPMTLFSASELRLAYGPQTLLDGVTIAISAGEKVGLVGRNGCAKISLLKILANENQADSGDISARRGLRIGYLPQEFELDPALSVYDNIAAAGTSTLGSPPFLPLRSGPKAASRPSRQKQTPSSK